MGMEWANDRRDEYANYLEGQEVFMENEQSNLEEQEFDHVSKTGTGWLWTVRIRGRGDMISVTTYDSVVYKDYDRALHDYIHELKRLQNNSEVVSSVFGYQT